jgi:hypothetical protein
LVLIATSAILRPAYAMSGPLLGGFRMSMAWFFFIGALGTFLLSRTSFGNWLQARDRGQAVILITHNFRHALSVADDLTVLAQGRVAAHFRRDEIELDELTDLVARVA